MAAFPTGVYVRKDRSLTQDRTPSQMLARISTADIHCRHHRNHLPSPLRSGSGGARTWRRRGQPHDPPSRSALGVVDEAVRNGTSEEVACFRETPRLDIDRVSTWWCVKARTEANGGASDSQDQFGLHGWYADVTGGPQRHTEDQHCFVEWGEVPPLLLPHRC